MFEDLEQTIVVPQKELRNILKSHYCELNNTDKLNIKDMRLHSTIDVGSEEPENVVVSFKLFKS